MNTCFKVFASYNILQYLCDFIHVLIFVTVSECRKSPKLTNIAIWNCFHDEHHFSVPNTAVMNYNLESPAQFSNNTSIGHGTIWDIINPISELKLLL